MQEPGSLGHKYANITPVSTGSKMGMEGSTRDHLDTDEQTKEPSISANDRTQGVEAGRVKLKHRCDECGKDFKRKADLNRHLKTGSKHSPPRYKCDVCGRCYTRGYLQKRHKCSEAGMGVKN